MQDQTVDIEFNEEKHQYTRRNKNYISVTTLLNKFNISPSYAGISTQVIQKASSRGTAVHSALEEYIKLGYTTPNVPELESFKLYVTNRQIDLKTARSEEVIYNDDYLIAGTVDFQYTDNNETVIADFKTTSKIHYESVSWQLSLYNYIICNGDITSYYFNKLMVFWFNNGVLDVKEVPTIEYEQIEQLLQANLNNTSFTPTTDYTHLMADSEVKILESILIEKEALESQIKKLDERCNVFKEKLDKAMLNGKHHKINLGRLEITRIDGSTRSSIDLTLLRNYLIDIGANVGVEDFKTKSVVKPQIRIKIK